MPPQLGWARRQAAVGMVRGWAAIASRLTGVQD